MRRTCGDPEQQQQAQQEARCVLEERSKRGGGGRGRGKSDIEGRYGDEQSAGFPEPELWYATAANQERARKRALSPSVPPPSSSPLPSPVLFRCSRSVSCFPLLFSAPNGILTCLSSPPVTSGCPVAPLDHFHSFRHRPTRPPAGFQTPAVSNPGFRYAFYRLSPRLRGALDGSRCPRCSQAGHGYQPPCP